MFTVLLDYIKGDQLQSTSYVVLAGDENDADKRAREFFESEIGGAGYIATEVLS